MSRKIDRILAYCQRTPWAILPDAGRVVAGILGRRAAGRKITRKAVRALTAEGRSNVYAHAVAAAGLSRQTNGTVAVIPIVGTIVHRADSMETSGAMSTTALVSALRSLDADPTVKAVVLDIDSPGGAVDGVQEAAAAIRALSIPVVAVANSMAASAAFWLAAQADEIVVTPSGEVGSVGVFAMHADISTALEQDGIDVTLVSAGEFKTEGNPFEPLSAEGKAEIQASVNAAFGQFVSDVAAGRGIKPSVVRSDFGKGRMVRGKAAVKAGMADRVATLEATVERVASARSIRKRRGVAAEAAPRVLSQAGLDALAEAQVPVEQDSPEYDAALATVSAEIDESVAEAVALAAEDPKQEPTPDADLDLRERRLRLLSPSRE